MTTTPSAAVTATRENSRESDGKFGHQPHAESVGVALPADRPEPILATVTLQQWDSNDNAIEVGQLEFDASKLLAELTPEQRSDLVEKDDYEASEDLYLRACEQGLALSHSGPFNVNVGDALEDALGKDPSYFDDFSKIPAPPRHTEAVLKSPLTPFEVGARMDSNGRISGRSTITLDDLVQDDQDAHDDMMDRRLIGNLSCMEESESKPVGVTEDGKIIIEISGWAGDIDEGMSDEQRVGFEAGLASRSE